MPARGGLLLGRVCERGRDAAPAVRRQDRDVLQLRRVEGIRFEQQTDVVLAVVGGLFVLMGKGVLPRVPGDLSFGKGNVRVFVPIGTSILVSIVLTIALYAMIMRLTLVRK